MTQQSRQAAIVVAVLLALIGFGALASQVPQRQATSTATGTPTVKPITYQGEEGKTVMELLEQNHTVVKQETEYGTFVTAIDGVEQSENTFWLYYIDGTAASEAADKAGTKGGQIIEWRYESF